MLDAPPRRTATQIAAANNDPRNYLPGTDADTKLLDLQPEQFGVLAGVQQSLTFIRDRCLAVVRKVFIQYARPFEQRPNDILAWKKFLLLPVIIFTT
jgi:hypothetical protein